MIPYLNTFEMTLFIFLRNASSIRQNLTQNVEFAREKKNVGQESKYRNSGVNS